MNWKALIELIKNAHHINEFTYLQILLSKTNKRNIFVNTIRHKYTLHWSLDTYTEGGKEVFLHIAPTGRNLRQFYCKTKTAYESHSDFLKAVYYLSRDSRVQSKIETYCEAPSSFEGCSRITIPRRKIIL